MAGPITDFLPFATAAGASVQAQADYAAAPTTAKGFKAGKLPPENLNKVLRQASFIIAALSQFVATSTNQDVRDNGDLGAFTAQLSAALGGDSNVLALLAASSGAGLVGTTQGQTVQQLLTTVLALAGGAEQVANKGQPNGYPPLGGDAKVPAQYLSISSGLTFVAVWDATSGAPAGSPNANHFWIVGVAGNTNLGGINTWNVGDWAISNGGASWARAPAAVPPASGISNDSAVAGANVAAALNTLNTALLILERPLWVGANTEIGAITSTVAEHVVDTRALPAGTLKPSTVARGRIRVFIPSTSTHGTKNIRVCVDGDTTNSLLLSLTAAQFGVIVYDFDIMVGVGSQNVSDSTARFNKQSNFGTAHGPVAMNFSNTDSNLQTRAWLGNALDTMTVELVDWAASPSDL